MSTPTEPTEQKSINDLEENISRLLLVAIKEAKHMERIALISQYKEFQEAIGVRKSNFGIFQGDQK